MVAEFNVVELETGIRLFGESDGRDEPRFFDIHNIKDALVDSLSLDDSRGGVNQKRSIGRNGERFIGIRASDDRNSARRAFARIASGACLAGNVEHAARAG